MQGETRIKLNRRLSQRSTRGIPAKNSDTKLTHQQLCYPLTHSYVTNPVAVAVERRPKFRLDVKATKNGGEGARNFDT